MENIIKNKNSAQHVSKRGDLIFYILLLVVPVTQFTIFYIFVNFNSLILAFQKFDFNTGKYNFAGFENFSRVFTDFANSQMLSRSFVNSLIAFAVKLVFGTGLALFFSFYIYKKAFLNKFYNVMLFLPTIISSVTMVMMFKYFTERALPGMINKIFDTDFIGFLSTSSTRYGTLLFFSVWSAFGTKVLIYTGSMAGINESLSEAAQLDGCSAWREFFSITLPMIYPLFCTLFVVDIAGIATDQVNAYLFYGYTVPNDCYTLGFYMFKDLTTGTAGLGEYPYLSAMGLVMTVVIAPITLGVRNLLNKYGPSVE